MITREQVADLREGDVVEIHEPHWVAGTVLRGPLVESDDGLSLADIAVQWAPGNDKRFGWMLEADATLTVISRAPRPLYVNHPRTEPAPGDVVRGTQVPGVEPGTWTYTFRGWVSTRSGDYLLDPPCPARLLVDGETGQVVL